MNVIITLVSTILLCGLIILPFLILHGLNKINIKYGFIAYLVIGLLVTSVIMLIFSWWSVVSDEMLLSYYEYDFEALNEVERFANVKPENVERVENIEKSLSGIGWPLKAIFSYALYVPYLFIVYLITYIIKKRKVTY